MNDVLRDNTNRRVTVTTDEDVKKKPAKRKAAPRKAATAPAAKAAPTQPTPQADPMVGKPCPLCGRGTLIKGKSAYGCSRWREGCTYRLPFQQ